MFSETDKGGALETLREATDEAAGARVVKRTGTIVGTLGMRRYKWVDVT